MQDQSCDREYESGLLHIHDNKCRPCEYREECVYIQKIEKKKDGEMKVNICGIPHTIVECEDVFNVDSFHFGQINYGSGVIRVNKDLTPEIKKETICHEMVHGILVHLGYNEQSENEQFVQALGNAIAQGFEIKVIDYES